MLRLSAEWRAFWRVLARDPALSAPRRVILRSDGLLRRAAAVCWLLTEFARLGSSSRTSLPLRLQAVGDDGLVGVDGVAATGAHLDVHVRAGGVAGRADGADDLAGGDLLALL